jgi:rhodanese-related sulfurtransferase
MSARIAPAALRARLTAGNGELALLDVREQGAFARSHILLASNAPLSRGEIDVPRLVPRRVAAIVLCDGGDGLAERAAGILARFGYSDLAVLDGGVQAWRDAGFALFEGVHVPSKAFGEFVEATYGTPHLTAEELRQLAAAGRKLVVLDSRPLSEYRQMSIPGGIDVPGAELVHRVRDLAPDPETLVVVNCAGRTRSIIGAQSLINAGLSNPVVALENGTMGWTLAGQQLEHGQARVPPPLTENSRAWAKAAAAKVAARFGVRTIGHDEVACWRQETEARTLYLCDVRLPEEYEAGHLQGARCTPGGQLVLATDAYLGTRGARVVLVDDDGVRATMTASWLIQMGWRDTYVLQDGLCDELERGAERLEVLGLDERAEATISPATLARMVETDEVQILDFADSRTFRDGHIANAWWLGRARLPEDLPQIPPAPSYVLTSPDGILARLALAEVDRLVGAPVHVLSGGTQAWRAAGLPLQAGAERMAGTPDDIVYLRPYDQPPEQAEQAMREYLQWEITLVSQLERDGTLSFPTYR